MYISSEVDSKIIVGEIKEKEVAREQYEAARKRGESAGYIGTKYVMLTSLYFFSQRM